MPKDTQELPADPELLQDMVEVDLSKRVVDEERLRADLEVCALEGLDPKAVYDQALQEAARPEGWPAPPAFEVVAPA